MGLPRWESQFLGRLIRSPGVPKERRVRGSQGRARGLELLAPICKRERSNQHHLSTGGVPHWSTWGCRQTLHQSFPSLVGLCPLPMQPLYSSLPVPPPRQGRDAPGVDLMASQTDVQFLTIKTFVWFLLFLWCHPECNRVAFLNASQARTTERVTGRKARGLQTEEIGCRCQTFFISLKRQEGTN